MDRLIAAIVDGNREQAIQATRRLLDEGAERRQIISGGVEFAMRQLDLKCTAQQFNVLEIMLSGRAVMGVVDELYPPDAPQRDSKGTVVVCSVQGDIHDLGKNIVKIVLTGAGYRVVDCGTDCPVEVVVETAQREQAVAVGVSSLITTTVARVREVRGRLRENGMEDVLILAGGAALSQASARELDVDFVARTAFDGLRFLEENVPHDRS